MLIANGIKIKQSDILGSNGVIHVISKVLVPPTQTIAQILSADTSYSFFVAALTTVNLLTTVSGPGKFTVFAPTNAAFRAAGITDITVVPVAILDAVVKYHIVTSNIFTADLVDNTPPVPTLQGGNILRYATPVAGVRIATSVQPISAITTGNIVATNGVIQVINRIMLP